ncbi:DUF2332 domain-containing protein [Ktedonosporobacter rubrisoli]|uniref:DUF2332 domain-containing protein n=1 Tax=Ktedonosporobacter rubrisoli TaxID=2509675 RepID=A0A4V0YYJ2_KTERU|nr:DUF2332 domain-containing protein [Ktedonosporobacter rubrisoli]QBD76411.1 DUF2332 domain-containing protein [Ktedonosporobacter rubrisoli]
MSISHLSQEQVKKLARHFTGHGSMIYRGTSPENSSPLYAYLSQQIAADPALLSLVAEADQSTTITNLFFGAVHFLLLSGSEHPLRAYYPDMSTTTRPPEEAFPTFREFCLEHAEKIREIVTTRYVQTNEVRRCAGLFPAFSLLASRLEHQPLAIVEIGASAGLHLLWDRYAYDYGSGQILGKPDSPVHIRSSVRGPYPLPAMTSLPEVIYRIGLDINPLNVQDPNDTRWLRALIWPEHADRLQLLEAALKVARQEPPTLVAGDAAAILPEVLAQVPGEAALCVFHSYVLNQMPESVRQRILEHIAQHARQRNLFQLAQDGYSLRTPPQLRLYTYQQGKMQTEYLANCESHGRWLEWLLPPKA